VRATEACNGAGFAAKARAAAPCVLPTWPPGRKPAAPGAGQCLAAAPHFRGSRSSLDEPRARASDGHLPSCKGCAAECPSNVDMARLKAEYLQKKMDRKGIR